MDYITSFKNMNPVIAPMSKMICRAASDVNMKKVRRI